MALKQHSDEQARYDQQVDNSRSYVLPFIEKTHKLGAGTNVMEIGTGEGGVLLPFAEKGCFCVGVDLAAHRIEIANRILAKEVSEGKMAFVCQNVYDEAFLQRFAGFFDVIILKDAIEHIPEQERFIPYLKKFLKPGGQIFFGFPPWYMPFGGHQQIGAKKLTSKLPYYHILPKPIYKGILKIAGEPEGVINELMDIHDTQISIERFERIIKASGLKVMNKQHYLINPIYKYKFGLQPREQWKPITYLPYLRNFLTTCVYYTVQA
ncbi:class I SAM-dependent methyltransferase [Taibaiella soli]|uniref:Class I SAM-dependent methyltransferase n=1 Tax=Taibaiella soli TaxID=1649169 RepID=A0A2W2BZ43_9BACT|nr:class I SAM-dependent methyltransferase [Taibaiella soli]PZF73103.1 class I SAM-dependent methyltransferase [Taibaiella soli]